MLKIMGAAALALSLAACGTNTTDRVSGGAAAGAATGATTGAVVGPIGVVAGGLIGAGAGAVTGATTSPREVNLGRPVWNDPEVRTPLDENNRRTSSRSHTRRQTASRPTNASDRAYMGGGMVVEQGGSVANPTGAPANTGTTSTAN